MTHYLEISPYLYPQNIQANLYKHPHKYKFKRININIHTLCIRLLKENLKKILTNTNIIMLPKSHTK